MPVSDQFLILLCRNDNMGNAKCYIHTVKRHSIAFYSVILGPFLYLGALQYSKDIKSSAEPKILCGSVVLSYCFSLAEKVHLLAIACITSTSPPI